MTEPNGALHRRLYWMLRHLLTVRATGGTPTEVEPRGIVQEKDALNAVLILGAEIDAAEDRGDLDHNQAAWMAALLMVIREHIHSLPPGLSEDEQIDLLTPDLVAMVGLMDAVSSGQGMA